MNVAELDPTSIQVAIHEAGHAVAHLVLNDLPPCSAPFLNSVSIVPGDGFLGVVAVDPWTFQSAWDALYSIIEALAGPTAELYSEHADLLPLVIERTIPGILADHADEDSDCAQIQKTIEWLGVRDPRALLRRLWDITHAIVASEWIGLEKVAHILCDRQVMGGDEFEAEWRRLRHGGTAAAAEAAG